jgi:hypothetical protein
LQQAEPQEAEFNAKNSESSESNKSGSNKSKRAPQNERLLSPEKKNP